MVWYIARYIYPVYTKTRVNSGVLLTYTYTFLRVYVCTPVYVFFFFFFFFCLLDFPKPFLEHTKKDYNSYLDLNRGFFFLTQAVAKKMKESNSGSIVNVG